MSDLNFVKNIDNLGRIVIPMDIRRKFNINTGDILSISCNDNNIMLNKYNTLDCNKVKSIISYFIEYFNIKVILMDLNNVIFSNVVSNMKLPNDLSIIVKSGNSMHNVSCSYIFNDKRLDGIYNMLPVISNLGIVGSLIIFGDESDKAYELCSILVKLIELEINIS